MGSASRAAQLDLSPYERGHIPNRQERSTQGVRAFYAGRPAVNEWSESPRIDGLAPTERKSRPTSPREDVHSHARELALRLRRHARDRDPSSRMTCS